MLPDFELQVTLNGAPFSIVMCDLPCHAFLRDFADSLPGTRCFGEAPAAQQHALVGDLDAWQDWLLEAAAVDPMLSPELIRRLGAAREELLYAYLTQLGWPFDLWPHRHRLPDLPPAELVGMAPGPRPWERHVLRTLPALPAPNIRAALRLVATKSRHPVDQLWTMWASEFIWLFRIAVTDDLARKDARASSSLIKAVGMEAA